jgi:hypothetical protein
MLADLHELLAAALLIIIHAGHVGYHYQGNDGLHSHMDRILGLLFDKQHQKMIVMDS